MGFFDDLGRKASETYKNTAEKTNKLTREMRLKSLMNDDKSKIDDIYKEIGKKIYEKHLLGESIDIESDLVNEIAKIDAYAKEVEDMRMEILSLKNLRLCKNCASEIPLSAKFCPKCGALQEDSDNTKSGEASAENTDIAKSDENNVENVASESIEAFPKLLEGEILAIGSDAESVADNGEGNDSNTESNNADTEGNNDNIRDNNENAE